MATYQFSTITQAQADSFNPLNDTLNVDFPVSAAATAVASSGSSTTLSAGGKTVTFSNFPLNQVTTTNVTFADGSQLLVGDNSLSTSADDTANTINGTAFNDQIRALGGDDILNGGIGSDLIYGNRGNDQITATANAGLGNDTSFGGQGTDTINFSVAIAGQNQLIYGNFGNDTLTGGLGNDSIFGGQDNDTIVTGDGANRVFGQFGNDTITGGAANDLIYGNQGLDNIAGGGGNDTIFGGLDSDIITQTGAATAGVIYGNQADDVITSAGLDTIYGGQGNDTISGGAGGSSSLFGNLGNDILTGNTGADTLRGGAGADTLNGAAGTDVFVIGATESGLGTGNFDVVTGFVSGADKLDLAVAGTTSNTRQVAASSAGYDAAFATVQGQFTPGTTYVDVTNGGSSFLFADYNADGQADFAIQVDNPVVGTDII